MDDCFVANDTYACTPVAITGRKRKGIVNRTAREPEDSAYSSDSERDAGDDRRCEAATDMSETNIPSSNENGKKVVICTGANASGKTVYLKQCALIPYMAQVCSAASGQSCISSLSSRLDGSP